MLPHGRLHEPQLVLAVGVGFACCVGYTTIGGRIVTDYLIIFQFQIFFLINLFFKFSQKTKFIQKAEKDSSSGRANEKKKRTDHHKIYVQISDFRFQTQLFSKKEFKNFMFTFVALIFDFK